MIGIFRRANKLMKTRDDLEARLLLHEALHCFGEYEFDDSAGLELRNRIREAGRELRSLGRMSG